jgi:hypothetical protein
MRIEEDVQVEIDHIGIHVSGEKIDIMLHFGLFEVMKLKSGKKARGHIVVTVKGQDEGAG